MLRSLRLEAGLSQEELAELAGLSSGTIGNLERRRAHRPYRRSVRLLADALQLTGPVRDEFLAAGRGPAPAPPAAAGDMIIIPPSHQGAGPGRWPTGQQEIRALEPGRQTGEVVPRALPDPGVHSTGELTALTGLRDRAGEQTPGTMAISAVGGTVRAGTTAAAVTRTLPRDVASFTGRACELAQLAAAATGTGGVVGIHAIGGMAGIGKTTFAVHAAHQLAPRFPDGQIFLSLHGHTPGQQPADPADALAGLLLTAGLTAAQIPAGLEPRMRLWRNHLADKQLLLVLDDAASSDQVRPLLPGTAGSLVLVTSRRHLTALEDTRAISLDTLPPHEAALLLARLTARPGLAPADPAIAELTALCGYLPLAIGMLASQLHHHPAWTPAALAADLAVARDRLALMRAENLSVATAFGLSYADLTGEEQRLFRRLGLHPGTTIDAYAAAALDNTDLGTARHGLEALYDQHLLTEPAHGRYRFHDLIREHARTLAAIGPASDNAAAISRLLDYYQYTATRADALLARQTRPSSAPAAAVPPPAGVPNLPGQPQALAWALTERANLLACLDHATASGQHARVIALTAALTALLRHDGPWTDALARHATAVQAARHLGDQPGEAGALNNLGIVWRLTGDYREAAQSLEAALGIYRDLGHRQGQANTLNDLGSVRRMTGDYRDAAQAHEAALGIHRNLGDRLGQANTLISLGIVRYLTGDYPDAAQAHEAALGIHRDLGYRLGQAIALNNVGCVWRMTGDYPEAIQALETALGIYRDLSDRQGEANTLNELGAVRRMTGDYRDAIQAHEAALGIHRNLGGRRGEANTLKELGAVRRMTGDCQDAAGTLEAALGIYRGLGDREGAAEVLNELGTLHRVRGDLDQAEVHHRQTLDLAREIGSRWAQAHALAGLGRCALAAGHTPEAQASLWQALQIFQRIGAAEAPGVAAELDALIQAEPPQGKWQPPAVR
jgi:tetratricopeptide (TPR) repeat protein/transcriptional regulator with XRE-family HTH domain